MALTITCTEENESSDRKYIELKGTFAEVFNDIQDRISTGDKFFIISTNCIDDSKRVVILEYPNN